jgi:hypothetical protein
VPPDPFGLRGGSGLTLDGPVRDTTTATVVESRGIDLVEGALASHCVAFVDGPEALDAFVVLRWLVDDDPVLSTTRLEDWRGRLEWWVFADGQLGRARVAVGGLAEDAWPGSGREGRLEADLLARDRGSPVELPTAAPVDPLAVVPARFPPAIATRATRGPRSARTALTALPTAAPAARYSWPA